MAGEKREILLDLLARDKTGPATKSFAKNLKDAGDAADKAGRSTKKFGEDSARAERAADGLGDQVDDAARSMGRLDREIALASAELRVLAKSFADTDDAAERLDISKAIRRGENDIRRLNKSKSLLSVDIQPRVNGQSFGKRLAQGLSEASGTIANFVGKALGPEVGTAIGIAAAPIVAAALGSALSAGAGAGVIGAGIALAVKKDPAIQAAGKDLGKRFVDGLTTSASANFAGPIRESLEILEGAADRSVTKISKAFVALGPSVVPLVRDLSVAVERIVTAFSSVAAKSGPALEGLGDSVKLVADGVATFVETVADGSPEAAANLELIAGATRAVLIESGNLIKLFNELSNNPWVTGPLIPLMRKHYEDVAAETGTFAKHTQGAADAMDGAASAARDEQSALDELSKELLAQTDPVFGLLNAQDKLREAQNKVKESTKEHGKSSRETKKALRELAEAALEVEGKAGALGDTFNGKLTPELRATLRAAGLTENQINDLGGQFQDAKKKGEAFAKRYSASVRATGVARVKTDLRSIREIASDIPRAITIAMRITGVTNVSKARAAINKQYEGRASGGPVTKNTPYWVGEEGPELIMPTHNGQVMSAAASKAIARRVGAQSAPASGRTGTWQVEVVGEAEMVRFFRSLIRRHNLLQPAGA